MSEYALSLPLEAKERYTEKLSILQCTVDLYADSFDCQCPLPPVSYANFMTSLYM